MPLTIRRVIWGPLSVHSVYFFLLMVIDIVFLRFSVALVIGIVSPSSVRLWLIFVPLGIVSVLSFGSLFVYFV